MTPLLFAAAIVPPSALPLALLFVGGIVVCACGAGWAVWVLRAGRRKGGGE